jgi:oligopeptide/dipeptide ABC transporter ATP-binding protein
MSQLEILDLRLALPVSGGMREVLRGVDLTLAPGESVGIVGESGSGKSMTLRSVARVLPPGAALSGRIQFEGRDIVRLDDAELRAFQANDIAMVFQDPRAHVNPVRTIGDFMIEGMVSTMGIRKDDARARAVSLLADVGIPDGERRLRQYPHHLSGGLLQRVMIAAALANEPRLLLADEPTTALDVSTQSDVLAIVDQLRRERGMALVFVTHDLELAAAVCDRIVVMYAGEVVEAGRSAACLTSPRHPYTEALLAARPHVDRAVPRLAAIPGTPLAAFEAPQGCSFADRCAFAADVCTAGHPDLVGDDLASVRCIRADELHPTAEPRGARYA